MILTQCAVCATELGLSLGKKCGRCSTRYCGAECQKQHWESGGHDKLCKKIKKAGGAEQYNANEKYTEAVAAAVEKCAEDTKGQTCFICTQALHWKTKEGLVRGCSCRGTAGFAHVSCLAEQAKILIDAALENNLDDQADKAWMRWYSCSLCEQLYHGVVKCALGWACWKTYVGRPETDKFRQSAMQVLGAGLSEAGRHEDVLAVDEARFEMLRRHGESGQVMLSVMGNLASTYGTLGRDEEALQMNRDVHSGWLRLGGEDNDNTLRAAVNYTSNLVTQEGFDEAKALLGKTIPVARRVLGEGHMLTLTMRFNYTKVLCRDANSTLDDRREAVTTLEEIERIARRVFGGAHPFTADIERDLLGARTIVARNLYIDPAATLDDLREAVTTLEEAERTARRKLGGAHPTTGVIEESLRDARVALGFRCEEELCEMVAAMTPGDA
jgi:hypothetical protein